MEKLLGRIAIGLVALTTISFALSRLLLAGEDPSGWWYFVPAYIFYMTIFVLIPALGLIALIAFAVTALRRYSCR